MMIGARQRLGCHWTVALIRLFCVSDHIVMVLFDGLS